ncbi:unnamed protein product [Lepidochelys olivacea]
MYQRQVHRALAQPRKVGSSREERGQDQGTSEQQEKASVDTAAPVGTGVASCVHWGLGGVRRDQPMQKSAVSFGSQDLCLGSSQHFKIKWLSPIVFALCNILV